MTIFCVVYLNGLLLIHMCNDYGFYCTEVHVIELHLFFAWFEDRFTLNICLKKK